MEFIRFYCPACSNLLVVPPEAAGQSGPCPSCQAIIQGPETSTAPPPEPEPAAPAPSPTANPAPSLPPALQPVPVPQALPPLPSQEQSPPPSSKEVPAKAEPPQTPQAPRPRKQTKSRPAPPEKKHGIPLPLAATITTLCSVVCFGVGLLLAQSSHFTKTTQEPTSPPAKSTIVPPLSPPQTDPSPDPLPTLDTSGAQSVLEAFLATGTWASRNAYVKNPDQALPAMEAAATQYGDGPIPFDSIVLALDNPALKIFALDTQKHELPFHVALHKESLGWLIDWEGFADFYYDQFESFATGQEGPQKGIFRLFLKPSPGESDPLSPSRFTVQVIHSNNTYQVSTSVDSEVRQEISRLLTKVQKENPEQLRGALKGPGLPFTLELSRSDATNPALKLERIVSYSWLPDEKKN